jgi:hypothetical protein
MDRAVDAATTEQALVRGIDNGIDRKRRDVGDANFEPRGTDRSEAASAMDCSLSRPLGLRLGTQVHRAFDADVAEMLVEETPRRALAADMPHLEEIVIRFAADRLFWSAARPGNNDERKFFMQPRPHYVRARRKAETTITPPSSRRRSRDWPR